MNKAAICILCLLGGGLGAQERGVKAPEIIIPESNRATPSKDETGTPNSPSLVVPVPGQSQLLDVANPFEAAKLPDDPNSPRKIVSKSSVFKTERPLFLINGEEILASEINELVAYYQSFRQGSTDILVRDALNALIPLKVAKAEFSKSLPSMDARIKSAAQQARLADDWTKLVARFSDDKEPESPADGAYKFAREVAVQPFDLLSHTSSKGALTEPFLTVYGYHVLEVSNYERGKTPKDDITHVRHLLVMYPQLKSMDKEGKDVRAEIKKLVASCQIQVLEPGLINAVPPALRDQIK